MVKRVREALHEKDFFPFKIRTSDGREFKVPTRDHAAVTPKGAHVLIFDDEALQTTLSGLHIVGFEQMVTSL